MNSFLRDGVGNVPSHFEQREGDKRKSIAIRRLGPDHINNLRILFFCALRVLLWSSVILRVSVAVASGPAFAFLRHLFFCEVERVGRACRLGASRRGGTFKKNIDRKTSLHPKDFSFEDI